MYLKLVIQDRQSPHSHGAYFLMGEGDRQNKCQLAVGTKLVTETGRCDKMWQGGYIWMTRKGLSEKMIVLSSEWQVGAHDGPRKEHSRRNSRYNNPKVRTRLMYEGTEGKQCSWNMVSEGRSDTRWGWKNRQRVNFYPKCWLSMSILNSAFPLPP